LRHGRTGRAATPTIRTEGGGSRGEAGGWHATDGADCDGGGGG